MPQFGTGFCFLRGVKTKRNPHEIQTQNEAARSSQGKREETQCGPRDTSTRRTTNAMKSSLIPAIRCAKKKLGMYCFAILKTGFATGGIKSRKIVFQL